MIDFEYKEKYNVYDLEKIIAILRGDGGCPWDRAQTHESIRRNFIEEAYEAAEAIDQQDTEHLREELGDVLTQVVFHAGIEQDLGHFDLDGAADAACKKMISRHPAVFGDGSDMRSGADPDSWEEMKREEKHQETYTSALEAVSKTLPALWRAEKLQKKVAQAGLASLDVPDLWVEMQDAMDALQIYSASGGDATEAIGNLLFFVVTAARLLHVDPETALQTRSNTFVRMFDQVEKAALESGRQLSQISQEERDRIFSNVIDAL